MAVTEALHQQFTTNLFEHPEGTAVGLTYFRHRGFHDDTIRRFQLGYALNQRDAYTNQALKIAGVVITEYDPRAQTSKALEPVVENAVQVLECPVLGKVRKSADIGKAQLVRKSIFDYAPNAKVAKEYKALVGVILNEGDI